MGGVFLTLTTGPFFVQHVLPVFLFARASSCRLPIAAVTISPPACGETIGVVLLKSVQRDPQSTVPFGPPPVVLGSLIGAADSAGGFLDQRFLREITEHFCQVIL